MGAITAQELCTRLEAGTHLRPGRAAENVQVNLARGIKVSPEDLWLLERRWQINNRGGGYAYRSARAGWGTSYVFLHKLVGALMGLAGPLTDHVNRNTLDCRRENLQAATHSQNGMNRLSRGFSLEGNRYRARFAGKHLGCFATEKEARAAFQSAREQARRDA